MSSELYLVAHKVRGEPAFDVAIKMPCPECDAQGCNECDHAGHFWIIPTSGHRAYPYWSISISALLYDTERSPHEYSPECLLDAIPTMPPDLPDHYTTRAEPKLSLADRLGLAAKPQPPLKRRF